MYIPKSAALLSLLASSGLDIDSINPFRDNTIIAGSDFLGSLSNHDDQVAILNSEDSSSSNNHLEKINEENNFLMKPYDVKTAASIARTLVYRESLLNLATLDVDSSTPMAFMEYYADCPWISASDDEHNDDDGDDGENYHHTKGNGSPFLLALEKSTSFRNIANGSKASITIRTGDHPITQHHVNPHYPGSIVRSPAGSPRVKLDGKFVDVDKDDHKKMAKLTKCFVRRHHDAVLWLPGSPIHGSKFVQFKVEKIYFIGGFGDRAYIGDIPLELYEKAPLLRHMNAALL